MIASANAYIQLIQIAWMAIISSVIEGEDSVSFRVTNGKIICGRKSFIIIGVINFNSCTCTMW